jgi:hypothetical protein
MVYNTQNYWVFGLCPLSGILETREHYVSGTASVLSSSEGGKGTNLNRLDPVIEDSSF